MPTITWVPTQQFNLQQISLNGARINGMYDLLASGKWHFVVSIDDRPEIGWALSGQVADEATARALADIGVQAAVDMVSALPAL